MIKTIGIGILALFGTIGCSEHTVEKKGFNDTYHSVTTIPSSSEDRAHVVAGKGRLVGVSTKSKNNNVDQITEE